MGAGGVVGGGGGGERGSIGRVDGGTRDRGGIHSSGRRVLFHAGKNPISMTAGRLLPVRRFAPRRVTGEESVANPFVLSLHFSSPSDESSDKTHWMRTGR